MLNPRITQIEALLQTAKSEILQKKRIEGRILIDQLKAQIDSFISETKEQLPVALRCLWLIERSRLFILERTPAPARTLLDDALKLTDDDQIIVEIYQMIAAIESQKEQKDWILKAIELAEKSVNPLTKRRLGSLYTTLAWKLFDLRQYENALATFEKAVEQLKLDGTPHELFVARWSGGKILRAMNRTEEALKIQNELLSEIRMDPGHDGRLYEEIAECLHSLNRADEAQSYFEMAYRELSADQWVADNQPVKLKRIKDLGKVRNPKRESQSEN